MLSVTFYKSLMELAPKKAFTHWELSVLLGRSGPSLSRALSRAREQGDVVQLKKGLYCLTEHAKFLSPFSIGTVLYENAYVTVETALSAHGMIPEATHMLAFGTTLRAKSIENAIGRFDFLRVPAFPFFAGVSYVGGDADRGAHRIATPLRAIADLVYLRKLTWDGPERLTEGYRIEEESLVKIPKRDWDEVSLAFECEPRCRDFLASMRVEFSR